MAIQIEKWGFETPTAAPVAAPTGLLNSMPPVSANYLYGLQDGMTQQDLGNGTFGILYNGANLGTGYAGVRDAYNTLALQNALNGAVQTGDYWSSPILQSNQEMWVRQEGYLDGENPNLVTSPLADVTAEQRNQWGEGMPGWVVNQMAPTRFKSQDELNAALQSYIQGQNFHNAIGDWEALGQALNGGVAVKPMVGSNPGDVSPLSSNNQDEVISGTNTLFGSTPVFERDASGNLKLVGYRTDLLPGQSEDTVGAGGVFKNLPINNEQYGTFTGENLSNKYWSANNWRELDADSVAKNAVMGADGKAFIPIENADKLKWTNKDSSQYQEKGGGGGGFFGAVFDFLDPIMDDIHPFRDNVQNDSMRITSSDSQKESFGKVAGPIATIVTTAIGMPYIGAAINATQSASTGDWGGVALNALSAAASYYSAAPATTGTDAASAGSTAASTSTLESIGKSMGMSAESAKTFATYAKNVFSGDLAKMTGGALNFGADVNRVLGATLKNAVLSAAQQGIRGEDFDKVVQSAVISGLASLVGSSVKEFTGSGVAGSVAGTVSGGLLQNEMDQGGGTSSTGGGTPATPATTPTKTSGVYTPRIERWGF